MDRIINNKLLHILALFLFTGFLCSCSDDIRGDYDSPGSGKEKMVSFSVRVPGSGTPKTYALDEDDENEVKSIEILLFDGSGNYTSQPIYSNSITTNSTDSKIKTFTVKVPEGTYDMVILANSRQSLGTALGSISTGDSKASVLNKLLLSNTGKWNATAGTTGYVPIPMWGEITNLTVNSSTPASNPVTLTRMVSKIDVALTHVDATSNFKLESIRLYNYYDRGYIAPLAANWNSGLNKVDAPSVPGTAQKPVTPVSSPLLYDGTAITTTDISSIGEIYTFEAEAGTGSSLQTNTCLVVGGTYTGDTQPTYYRVDFANKAGSTTTYLPLLRNHHYKVNINKISGPGLATPGDAFNSHPVNIQASIVQWNDGRFTDFAINDQYLVGVSQSEFNFSREQRTAVSDDNTLSVITDYPTGWKVSKIVDGAGNPATWLTCSPMNGANPAGNDIKLLMTENTGPSLRTAYIHLTAERLNYIVKVNQDILADIGIYLTDTGGNDINVLEFTAAKDVKPAIQQFKLRWAPATADVFFNSTAIKNTFTFDTSAGQDNIPVNGSYNDPSGTKTFGIQPTAITTANINSDPFYERSSVVLYTISDGVSTINKTLTLRQFVYNMVPKVEAVYLMDGGNLSAGTQKSFGVRSNTPFTVTVKSNPNSVITLRTFSGGANTSANGTPVYFDIVDDLTNPTLYQRDAVVTIKSPLGHFPDTDVTLNCASGIIQPKANSYIMAPNGIGILIPVSRANESTLGSQLGASDAFTADLVWTDNVNKVASNSNLKMIRAVGAGNSGYVLVMPGSAEGNAVVAIKNASNKILWSWHIWVTSYTPAPVGTGKFMDRNLGAIGNTAGQVNTKGLLYQWGRKDAFPGSTTVNGTTEPTIYNASSTTSIAKTAVSTANNMANAIANPATYYYGTGGNYDWYSNGSTQNNTLWGHGTTKTVYDPCPDGWRVPQNGVWSSLTTSNFTWSAANYGRTNAAHGGFYPAAGYRYTNSGAFTNVGAGGYYWSASPSGVHGYYLTFGSSSVTPSFNASRAIGFSVRCVQE